MQVNVTTTAFINEIATLMDKIINLTMKAELPTIAAAEQEFESPMLHHTREIRT
jgi:hypothetical protein